MATRRAGLRIPKVLVAHRRDDHGTRLLVAYERISSRPDTPAPTMDPHLDRGHGDANDVAVARNHQFYTSVWSATTLISPERFNTWPFLSTLTASAPARLEVGSGLRPRLPVPGTCFVDISREGLVPLRGRGGTPVQCEATALPFGSGRFDLVCAFDIVEHVVDDRQLFRELARVAKPGGTIVFSVPLDPHRWSAFDELVGHVRRYEPADLLATIGAYGLVVERSAIFGMAPRSRLLMRFAAWGLRHKRALAMRWYNAAFMPLGLRLQRPLAFRSGMLDATDVGEVLLVCRQGC
jgi:SAM-dependent methyltransferase